MIDPTSLAKLVRALEGERGHGMLVKGVRRLKLTKVIPARSGPAPVHGRLSLEVGGYRIDMDLEADDIDLLTREGAKLV